MPKVRTFRLRFGLSQTDFGRIFGISAKGTSNIETGFRRPSRTVEKILGLFEVLPDEQVRDFISKLTHQKKTVISSPKRFLNSDPGPRSRKRERASSNGASGIGRGN
jgi:transcriptional regulator with XRE-family HTH domain